MNRFYSHGKFLLTGEYLVLEGALALALPLKLGQTMTVETFPETSPNEIIASSETFQETSLPGETYRITNLMGQTLMAGQITAEKQQIDVSVLHKGMYFITVAGKTQRFVVK